MSRKRSRTGTVSAGTLFVCGHNNYGQLGLGSYESQTTLQRVELPSGVGAVRSVACGEHHTVVVSEDGTLLTCGYNDYGQLGLGGDEGDQTTLQKVQLPNGVGAVRSVACGSNHTAVVCEDGTLLVCECNAYGQLGLGSGQIQTTLPRVELPSGVGAVRNVVYGSYHTVVVSEDGTLYVCGRNYHGQLGLSHMEDETTLQRVELRSSVGACAVRSVACGGDHTLVVSE